MCLRRIVHRVLGQPATSDCLDPISSFFSKAIGASERNQCSAFACLPFGSGWKTEHMTRDFLAIDFLAKNLLPHCRPQKMLSPRFHEIQGRASQPSGYREPDRRTLSFSAQRKTRGVNPGKRRNAIRLKRSHCHSSHFAPRTCLWRSPSTASSNPSSGSPGQVPKRTLTSSIGRTFCERTISSMVGESQNDCGNGRDGAPESPPCRCFRPALLRFRSLIRSSCLLPRLPGHFFFLLARPFPYYI